MSNAETNHQSHPHTDGGAGTRVLLQLTVNGHPLGYFGTTRRGWGIVVSDADDAVIFTKKHQKSGGAIYSATLKDDTYYLNHNRQSRVGLFPDSEVWQNIKGTGFVEEDDQQVLAYGAPNIIVEPLTTEGAKMLGVNVVPV